MVSRLFAWITLGILAAFLINNYLVFWRDAPSLGPIVDGLGVTLLSTVEGGGSDWRWIGNSTRLQWAQIGLYAAVVALAIGFVAVTRGTALRTDSDRMTALNTYFIRACFWAVLLVGLADSVISFLRVEGLLDATVGMELASDLGKSSFRGSWVHMPLIGLSFGIAFFGRSLGFTWLALLVVVAELLIVIGRFVFSYEQAFMADLVRFWYAALFLFASGYTLLRDGHVRVDILYASLPRKWKGLIDACGAVLLGMTLCWTVLILGTATKSSIINSPLLVFEVTQAGFGLYVKYLMAGFLAVFAVSMMIQFTAAFLSGVADWRGDPGHRDREAASAA